MLDYISHQPQNVKRPNHYHQCVIGPWLKLLLYVLVCKHLVVKLLLWLWLCLAISPIVLLIVCMFCLSALSLTQSFVSDHHYFVVCLHHLSTNLHSHPALPRNAIIIIIKWEEQQMSIIKNLSLDLQVLNDECGIKLEDGHRLTLQKIHSVL